MTKTLEAACIEQEDAWGQLEVVKLRQAARTVMVEEPHGGYRGVGCKL